MLYLRTGLPGAGKTLNAIREIDQEHQPDPADPTKRLHRDPDNPDLPPRTIYYYGIPELKADKLKSNWVEFDTPEEWFNLPDGSVIVIDEAQRVFGNDGTRARPEKVTRFETHRHQGLDIHLITQHPSLLSSPVRKLVGKHINFIRPYGRTKGIFRHEYEFCIDSPEKRVNFKQAQEEKVVLDPAYFGTYKSSTVHTHKPTTPAYLKRLPLLIGLTSLPVLFLVGLVWWLVSSEKSQMDQLRTDTGYQIAPGATPAAPGAPGQTVQAAPSNASTDEVTPERFVQDLTPRVPDVPSSAPRYDTLNVPRSAPRPVCSSTRDPGLVERSKERGMSHGVVRGVEYACQCYTQQVTRLETSFEFCMDVVNNGYFDDTRNPPLYASGRSNGSLTTSAAPTAIPAPPIDRGRAASSAATVQPRLTVVQDSEFPSRPWRSQTGYSAQ